MKLQALAMMSLALCGCEAAPTQQQTEAAAGPANIVLHKRFAAGFDLVTDVWAGLGDTQQFRQRLLAAHRQAQTALLANNDAAAMSALLQYMEINRSLVLGSARGAEALTHGKGGGGSSDIAADGANTGARIAVAAIRRNVNRTKFTCGYFFAETGTSFASLSGYDRCTVEKMDELYRRMRLRDMSIKELRDFLDHE